MASLLGRAKLTTRGSGILHIGIPWVKICTLVPATHDDEAGIGARVASIVVVRDHIDITASMGAHAIAFVDRIVTGIIIIKIRLTIKRGITLRVTIVFCPTAISVLQVTRNVALRVKGLDCFDTFAVLLLSFLSRPVQNDQRNKPHLILHKAVKVLQPSIARLRDMDWLALRPSHVIGKDGVEETFNGCE